MPVTLSSKIQLTKLADEVQDDGYAFEAVILSGEPIDHWHRFVVDLSSITPHKPRLTVDYNHNSELIIGYGENFHVTPEGLKSTGKLTPGSFADEIIKHWKAGVPFEASVVIDLDNAVETRVGADSSTVVNGRTYQGPISVYANVPLEGYSICPHGADKFTTFTLLSKELNFMTKTKVTPKGKTNLSDDSASGEAPETKVKDPDLAEFCEVYGREKGLDLWQSGADINDIRTLKELIEKYGVPEPPGTEPTTELNDDDPPADPKEDDEDKKEKTELKAIVTKLAAEVTKLSAALPRGEAEPVKHGFQQEPEKKELTEKEKYLASVRKSIKKN